MLFILQYFLAFLHEYRIMIKQASTMDDFSKSNSFTILVLWF